MKGIPAVLLLVTCAVVVLSAFMPWIRFMPQMPPGFDMQGMDEFLAEAMTATGWQGNVSLAGVTVPNWFVPILAIAIAAMTLMKGADVWDAPRALTITCAGYCVAHLGFLIFVVMMAGSQASLAFGAPVAFLASLGALGIMIFGHSGNDEYQTISPQRSQFEAYGATHRSPMQDDPMHRDPMQRDPMPNDAPPPPDFSPRPRQRL